jgi:hypothetical protein
MTSAAAAADDITAAAVDLRLCTSHDSATASVAD